MSHLGIYSKRKTFNTGQKKYRILAAYNKSQDFILYSAFQEPTFVANVSGTLFLYTKKNPVTRILLRLRNDCMNPAVVFKVVRRQ